MVVIYAEKASLAKEIAHALKAGKRHCLKDEPTVGWYEFQFKGEQAILCHGVGHLAQLVPAKMYDSKFEKWNLDVFPCIPDTFRVAPKSATLKCAKLVKNFFDKADWLINATDADREGELIFSYVCEICKCNKPFKRVWIEDLTEEKLQKAFNNLKEPQEQLVSTVTGNAKDLALAGRARDISDWLIGTNLTVADTKKFGAGMGTQSVLLTLGRVQTPTLNLIVEREKAIKSHKKTPYWKLTADFSSPNGKFTAEYEKGNFTSETEAKTALSECNGKPGIVQNIETKHKSQSVPLLFNSTQLQIAASNQLDWDSDKTAAIMQSLYDKGIMAYPRTSTEHLTEAMMPEVKETLEKLLEIPEFQKYKIDKWADFTKRHFDDSKVGSHPAIIPTINVPEKLDNLTDDEKKLYELLAVSLIRIIYPKAVYDNTVIKVAVGEHIFKASGKVVTNEGWQAVKLTDFTTEKKKTEEKQLPTVLEGQELTGEYKITEGITEPPKRYTEAELLAAMELAGQKIEDEEARTLMKLQKRGLGTDATRAPILKSLFSKGYFAKKGKTIYPTELGMYIIETLPVDELKSAELTGELEKQLNDIAIGKGNYDEYIANIKKKASEWYAIIANSEEKKFVSEIQQKLICPFCGSPLRKHDWGYGCSGFKTKGCKYHINATIAGKKITENQVIHLCQNGRTNIIKGFKAKSGSEFDAYLFVDKEKKEVSFQFPDRKK